MVSHFFAQVITENFLWRMLLPILQWGDEVTQQKSVLFISVKRKTSFMLVHQKIQLSSNSVEHNHISHQLKKGNHDLLHYLNWILFLTVMLWLSGIMIFVVSSNQQGKNRRFLVGLQNVFCDFKWKDLHKLSSLLIQNGFDMEMRMSENSLDMYLLSV